VVTEVGEVVDNHMSNLATKTHTSRAPG